MDRMSATSLISLRTLSDATGLESERKAARRPSSGTKGPKKASPYGTVKSSPKKPKRTGREMWVESLQQGGGLSAEGKITNTWRNGKPLNNSSTASNFLKELLTASGTPLPNRISRPSSATSRVGGTARVGGTGPVYKDAESYYDEIQVLKRQLRQQKSENEETKAKQVHMEDEIIAKSRKIEELLNPELQSNDMRRTLTSKKTNTSEVVMSLRRKVYRLEENLRDKEITVRKMKNDIKQTNVEELSIENQMCLYEIDRLSQIVKETKFQSTQNVISEDMINDALKDTKGRKTQILLKRLTDDNQGLVLENKSLKNDLMKLNKESQSDLNFNKDYEDMNRNELLQKISSLEQSLKVEEKKLTSEITTSEVDSETIDDRCIDLKGPLPQQIKQLRARERELISEVENLENTVKKLKEDRSHYRKKNDEYRQQLDNLKKKSDDVGSDTASVKGEKSPKHRQQVDNLKKKVDNTESDTASVKSEKSPKHKKSAVSVRKVSNRGSKGKEDKITEAKIIELQETNAARKIQRGWRKRQNNTTLEKGELQNKDEEDELKDAILCIQSSWRGHKAREAYITSVREREFKPTQYENNDELEDNDILLIQSALRGHSSRKQLLERSKKKRSSLSKKSAVVNVQDERQYSVSDDETDDETDDDDDVVIGSNASLINNSRANIASQKHETSRSSKDNFRSLPSPRDKKEKMFKVPQYDNTPPDDRKETKLANSRKQEMQQKERQHSLNNLKSASSPWPDSQIIQSDDDDDDDDLVISSRSKKMSKKGSKNEVKPRKKNKDNDDTKDITSRWADSGRKDEDEKETFQKRLSLRKSQQLLKDFEADEDDDDDLVVAPTFQKKLGSLANKKSLLDDELF